MDEKYTRNELSIFDNPMVRSALKSLTPEQLETYKKVGEQIYNKIDFSDGKIIDEMDDRISLETVAYIESGLKSGLLPCDMDDDEVNLMVKTHGFDWFKKYGFTDKDMPECQKNLMRIALAGDSNAKPNGKPKKN